MGSQDCTECKDRELIEMQVSAICEGAPNKGHQNFVRKVMSCCMNSEISDNDLIDGIREEVEKYIEFGWCAKD